MPSGGVAGEESVVGELFSGMFVMADVPGGGAGEIDVAVVTETQGFAGVGGIGADLVNPGPVPGVVVSGDERILAIELAVGIRVGSGPAGHVRPAGVAGDDILDALALVGGDGPHPAAFAVRTVVGDQAVAPSAGLLAGNRGAGFARREDPAVGVDRDVFKSLLAFGSQQSDPSAFPGRVVSGGEGVGLASLKGGYIGGR